MRLLYVVPYTPNPIRIRPYNLIRRLVQHRHRVTLACVWESAEELASLDQYRSEGLDVIGAQLSRARTLWNAVRALPDHAPLQSAYSWQPELVQMIAREHSAQAYDVVHIEHLRGARLGLAIKKALSSSPFVWDSVDCISELFRQSAKHSASIVGRWVTRFELNRTRKYEAYLITQFERTLVVSPSEQRALQALAARDTLELNASSKNGSRIQVLTNGVDSDYFRPIEDAREPATIVFSGKLSYHANTTAALFLVQEIMPRVWERHPEVRVQIVGQKPPQRILNLQRKYPGRVEVTGYVPDLRRYVGRATLAVAPIVYGAGIQNKVLEAMAMETPVVTTPQAASALAVENGRELLFGDGVRELSQQIVCLLQDPTRRAQLGANGRRYVQKFHNWDSIVSQLSRIYQDVIREAHPG